MARIHGITKHDQTNTYWGMATTVYFNHCPHLPGVLECRNASAG